MLQQHRAAFGPHRAVFPGSHQAAPEAEDLAAALCNRVDMLADQVPGAPLAGVELVISVIVGLLSLGVAGLQSWLA